MNHIANVHFDVLSPLGVHAGLDVFKRHLVRPNRQTRVPNIHKEIIRIPRPMIAIRLDKPSLISPVRRYKRRPPATNVVNPLVLLMCKNVVVTVNEELTTCPLHDVGDL